MPVETMLDEILVSSAMGNSDLEDFSSAFTDVAVLFGWNSDELLEEYEKNREFTAVHKVLLGIDDSHGSLRDFLAGLAAAETLSGLIDCADSRHRSPLAWAVEFGWTDATETLIEFGANVHQLIPSKYGPSPLLHLAIAGPDPIQSKTQILGVVRILLQAGVDINATDHELWTAMHIAASWNLKNAVMELVQFGGDTQAVTGDGESAFDLAIKAGADSVLVDLLRNIRSEQRIVT